GLPNPPGVLTVSWTKISGPGTVTFGNPSLAATTATFSTAGTYVLRLTANDSLRTTSDDVTIDVVPVGGGTGGLSFDGQNDHVTFGVALGLGTATFTLETWF